MTRWQYDVTLLPLLQQGAGPDPSSLTTMSSVWRRGRKRGECRGKVSNYHVNVFASPLHRVVGWMPYQGQKVIFCFDGPPKKTIVYSLQVVLCCHGSTINAFGGHVPQVVAITDRQSELICSCNPLSLRRLWFVFLVRLNEFLEQCTWCNRTVWCLFAPADNCLHINGNIIVI